MKPSSFVGGGDLKCVAVLFFSSVVRFLVDVGSDDSWWCMKRFAPQMWLCAVIRLANVHDGGMRIFSLGTKGRHTALPCQKAGTSMPTTLHREFVTWLILLIRRDRNDVIFHFGSNKAFSLQSHKLNR